VDVQPPVLGDRPPGPDPRVGRLGQERNTAMSATVTRTLDLKGLSCPMPIVKTARAMKEMASGEVLEALATDPGSVPDFAAWAKSTRNELIEQTEEGGVYRFVLRKR
jgi:tRNA 2-thiouridine synthesizing protein A